MPTQSRVQQPTIGARCLWAEGAFLLGTLMLGAITQRALAQELMLEPLDNINRIQVQFVEESQRFGLVCPKLRDPRNVEQPKRLTRDERGATNNTVIRVDGYEYHFGGRERTTKFVRQGEKLMRGVPIPGKDRDKASRSVWEADVHKVRVTQSVEIVVSEMTRLYDTALIRYQVTNRDTTTHTVGLRVMLDTFVGATDGVPFYIAPIDDKPARLVQTMEVFAMRDMPHFIQALESSNLNDANAALAVAGLRLKGFEPIEKMVLCRWPAEHGGGEVRWGTGKGGSGNFPYEPMDKNPNAKDSCLLLYWAQINMRPNETRELGFTYGLGRMMSDLQGNEREDNTAGRMRLFCPKASTAKPFVACAYVKASNANQRVQMQLAPGIALADGEQAVKNVPPTTGAGYAQVTWRLQAARTGAYEIRADAPGIGLSKLVIRVVEHSLLDG